MRCVFNNSKDLDFCAFQKMITPKAEVGIILKKTKMREKITQFLIFKVYPLSRQTKN